MLNEDENNLVARVGKGTPMGELMRRYWLPAMVSGELVADRDPVRIMLLGEKLLAFRDSDGRIGVIDHLCPHRCASLFYGRNEEGGIRCVYHGWKFDVAGNCLDMPNVPPAQQSYKERVKATAYQAAERNGVVWVYMGDGDAPPLPEIPYNLLPPERLRIMLQQRECNWLQALEGDIDGSHVDFLHGGSRGVADYPPDDPRRFGALNRAPEYEVTETGWGTLYGAKRAADPGESYWRIGQFIFPFWTVTPSSPFGAGAGVRAWVPMDDTHVMLFTFRRRENTAPQIGAARVGFRDEGSELLPNTTDWYGRFRMPINRENDHGLDRALQREVNYTGVMGIIEQDHAITESMGPIAERTKEHLVVSDHMIAVTRRRLIDAARKLRDEGEAPPCAEDPSLYANVEGGYCLAPVADSIWDVYNAQFAAFQAAGGLDRSILSAPLKLEVR
jgi:phthalate 4,5-dioxygenase oxygenase subunit